MEVALQVKRLEHLGCDGCADREAEPESERAQLGVPFQRDRPRDVGRVPADRGVGLQRRADVDVQVLEAVTFVEGPPGADLQLVSVEHEVGVHVEQLEGPRAHPPRRRILLPDPDVPAAGIDEVEERLCAAR